MCWHSTTTKRICVTTAVTQAHCTSSLALGLTVATPEGSHAYLTKMRGKTVFNAVIVLSLAVLVACSQHRNGHDLERRLLGVDEWGGQALARKLLGPNFFGIRVTITKGGSAPADGGDDEEEGGDGEAEEGEGKAGAEAEGGDRRK